MPMKALFTAALILASWPAHADWSSHEDLVPDREFSTPAGFENNIDSRALESVARVRQLILGTTEKLSNDEIRRRTRRYMETFQQSGDKTRFPFIQDIIWPQGIKGVEPGKEATYKKAHQLLIEGLTDIYSSAFIEYPKTEAGDYLACMNQLRVSRNAWRILSKLDPVGAGLDPILLGDNHTKAGEPGLLGSYDSDTSVQGGQVKIFTRTVDDPDPQGNPASVLFHELLHASKLNEGATRSITACCSILPSPLKDLKSSACENAFGTIDYSRNVLLANEYLYFNGRDNFKKFLNQLEAQLPSDTSKAVRTWIVLRMQRTASDLLRGLDAKCGTNTPANEAFATCKKNVAVESEKALEEFKNKVRSSFARQIDLDSKLYAGKGRTNGYSNDDPRVSWEAVFSQAVVLLHKIIDDYPRSDADFQPRSFTLPSARGSDQR